jgi:hypothetical protein
MGAFRFCLGLWVFQPAGPLVHDRRRLEVVPQISSTRCFNSLSNCSVLSPSIPLAARRGPFCLPIDSMDERIASLRTSRKILSGYLGKDTSRQATRPRTHSSRS